MTPAGRLALLLAPLLLMACLGETPRDQFYRLQTGSPARLDAPILEGVVEVQPLRADPLLRARPLLRSGGPGSVKITPHRYHLWADSPVLAVQRALIADLRARGLAERIVTPEARVRDAWSVSGRIHRFEYQVGSGSARAVVELELGLAATAPSAASWSQVYRVERDVPGLTIAAIARALGEGTGLVFERFAADIAARHAED